MTQTTLGRSWHASLQGATLEGYASPADLDAARRQQSAEAEASLRDLTSKHIPAGIASCVARLSPSLTIAVPHALASYPQHLAELERNRPIVTAVLGP